MAISQEPTGGSGSSSVQDMDAAEENPPKAAASRSSCSRRPRVREVGSRFMSPVVSSSSSSSSSLTDLHLSSSFSNAAKCLLPPKHHHHHHQRSQSVNRRHLPSSPIHSDSESEPLSSSSSSNSLIIVRNSLDTPLPGFHQHPTKRSLFAASNKLLHFKENGDPHLSHSSSNPKFPPRNTTSSSAAALPVPHRRTDTPTVPRSIQNFPTTATSSRSRGFALAATTAAAKLVQSTGLAAPKRNAPQEEIGQIQRNNPTPTKSSSPNDLQQAAADSSVSCDSSPSSSSSDTYTITSQGGFCDSPPIPMQTNKNPHPISDFRSSMPEAELLPTMSARLLGEDNSNDASFSSGDFCRMAASPCHRSLNSALSSCHQSSSPTKSFSRSSLLTKLQSGPAKPGAICLPPNPSNIKSGMEAKKSRKPSNHQDDVQSLRMLHSRYLQWRLANAKVEAAMNVQRIEAEQSLHSVMAKVSEMRESVAGKRIELEQLTRIERLSIIVDSQFYPQKLPYLAEWAILEEDYSSCLSGAINALNDSLIHLPVVGNARADATELSESLSSAIKVLEAIFPNVQSFLPKYPMNWLQGVDHVISELAGVVARERALMEECGALLSKSNILQTKAFV
ncbi:hypothetical protein ACLOJK_041531 [Asimina triloba]